MKSLQRRLVGFIRRFVYAHQFLQITQEVLVGSLNPLQKKKE